MGIKLGLVGLGSFGSAFAPLFAAHPLVDGIMLCDAEGDKLARWAADPRLAAKLLKGGCFESYDDICRRPELDALVVITQPWLHAGQCLQALEAGKDVYSAVPLVSLPDDEETLSWCARLIEAVRRTGKNYMLGETTIYRPQTMFCRRQAAQHAFGDFVYAEAEYAHDLDTATCSLRQVQAARTTGKIGSQYAAFLKPYRDRGLKTHPMSYPTHSVSGVIDVLRSRPLKVSACGHRNTLNDPYFANSDFSDIVAFFHLANGVGFRVGELREISDNIGLSGEDFRIFGTRGSYSCNVWRDNGRVAPTPEPKPNVATELTAAQMRDPLPQEVADAFNMALNSQARPGDVVVPSGHGGSHPYLVHEFVSAVAEHREPRISAYDAALYMAMGVAAHQSAVRDGELVPVEDFGKVWAD